MEVVEPRPDWFPPRLVTRRSRVTVPVYSTPKLQVRIGWDGEVKQETEQDSLTITGDSLAVSDTPIIIKKFRPSIAVVLGFNFLFHWLRLAVALAIDNNHLPIQSVYVNWFSMFFFSSVFFRCQIVNHTLSMSYFSTIQTTHWHRDCTSLHVDHISRKLGSFL